MTPYEVKSVSMHCGNMPVSAHFSYGTASVFPFIIVKINTAEFHGIGETLVEPDDSLWPFAKNLIGNDIRRLDTLLLPWKTEFQRRFCEALSMAMYDLLGKICGLPVWALLGGKRRNTIPLMPCIFPETPKQAAELAEKFAAQGCKYLKTKLIGNLDEDAGRVRAIRKVFPSCVHLQGDANEGYKTIPAAVDAVMRLGEAGLDFFEDPLKGGPAEYHELCEKSPARRTKITADLLARSISDLSSVLQNKAVDAISLHPCQMGSLSCARQHVDLIKSYGLPFVLAGTGFTGVGTAAWQHLTASMSDDGPSGELGGFVDHSMPDSIVKNPLTDLLCQVTLPNTPGLGVELNEQVLKKYQISSLCER